MTQEPFDSSSVATTTVSQIGAIIEAINASEEAIAAMEAALAVLNQLLAQLQQGRRLMVKTSSSISCEQLVQTVAQMVSALPEDPEKVVALANSLAGEMSISSKTKQTTSESEKLMGEEPTCSEDQILFLTKQRDWLRRQLDLA